jgi:hypothetical protein
MKAFQTCVVALLMLVSACSSAPSVAEYAEELEGLVTIMNARLDEIDAELPESPDLDQIKGYATQRIFARSEFLAGLRSLEPPEDVADVHDTAIGIMERLTASETAMVDRVLAWESAGDIEAIWETPEGIAAEAADAKAVELCLAAQADFNQTAERAKLEGVPWIPSDMKEVILVAFGCEAENR